MRKIVYIYILKCCKVFNSTPREAEARKQKASNNPNLLTHKTNRNHPLSDITHYYKLFFHILHASSKVEASTEILLVILYYQKKQKKIIKRYKEYLK